MYVGIIKSGLQAFSGYADKKASNKKILRDVLKKGDAAYVSGLYIGSLTTVPDIDNPIRFPAK